MPLLCCLNAVAVIPLPFADFRQVAAVGGDILVVLYQLVLHQLDEEGAAIAQLGQALDYVDDQIKAVDAVLNPHVEGGGNGALFNIAPDMEIFVPAAVGQLMHQGGVAVEGEDDLSGKALTL